MSQLTSELSPRETADRLRGVIGFPVTPFKEDRDQAIDWEAFEIQVERMANSGLVALVIAGGTGEFFSLRPSEVVSLTKEAARIIRDRCVLLAGVGFGPTEGANLAAALAAVGAAGLVVLPPYYPSPDDEGLVSYYARIAAAAPHTAVIPYSRGAARLTPAHLEKLAAVANIVGIKDGHGDVRMFQRNRVALGDRFVWIAGAGDDIVGPYAAAGAEAYTSSIACFDSPLAIELWRLATTNAFAELRELSDRMVMPWFELRSRRNGFEVAIMKGAMESFGMRTGSVRPPLARLSPADREAVDEIARSIGQFRAQG